LSYSPVCPLVKFNKNHSSMQHDELRICLTLAVYPVDRKVCGSLY